MPLFRKLQKYAVLAGGGENHRFGLYDMFLIKENHIAIAGSITKAVSLCKDYNPDKKIEVEVKNFDEVREAVKTSADVIMLDNMNDSDILTSSIYIKKNSSKKVEVSGNVDIERLQQLKNYPIDYISIGSLTHSVNALDFSLIIC